VLQPAGAPDSPERDVVVETERGSEPEEAARAWLAAIVDSSDDAIIAKTLEGIITHWNGAAQQMYGYTADEIVGRPVSVLIPPDRPDELPHILDRIAQGERVDHYETERVRKDGRRIEVSVTISPIRDASGAVRGASAIARDITERKLAEQERARLRAELDELRRHFTAMVTHELRNPLTSLWGFAQLMKRRQAYNDEAVDAILAQSAQLDRLLSDLAAVTQGAEAKMELRRSPVDLLQLTRRSVDEAQASTKAHRVRADLPDRLPPGHWDADRLSQVFRNLLLNAVKYSPDGGDIVVTVRDERAQAVVSVRDQGRGISADDLPRIFDRFYRARGAASMRGSGLGLPITKLLVEAHGGRIQVESKVGEGSVFTFTLPYGHPKAT
jgi:PAS domain S-box-containing protein